MSPVFRREDGYVFKIFSNEEDRVHIHVIKAEKEAKFWLEPNIELADNFGFSSKEINIIKNKLTEYASDFKHKYAIHVGKRVND